jgi:hypothetical protein
MYEPFEGPLEEVNWILHYDGPDSFLLLHDMVAAIEEHETEMKKLIRSLSNCVSQFGFKEDEI